tara:strand:+ start:794 stop:1063 length:270 start_codon:yes stop_codon:yes gene_type:complete
MNLFLLILLATLAFPAIANAEGSLNVEFLSPTGSIGFFVLIIGIVVTAFTFYVFYNVSSDIDSVRDKNRKIEAKEMQEKKIARLYPKRK